MSNKKTRQYQAKYDPQRPIEKEKGTQIKEDIQVLTRLKNLKTYVTTRQLIVTSQKYM